MLDLYQGGSCHRRSCLLLPLQAAASPVQLLPLLPLPATLIFEPAGCKLVNDASVTEAGILVCLKINKQSNVVSDVRMLYESKPGDQCSMI